MTMKRLPALLRLVAARRVLVVGDAMLDHYFHGDADRISPEAPVPVVQVARESDCLGGAANVANAIAALGAAVEIVGAIGADANGRALCDRLRENHIAFDERLLLPAVRTITKSRVIVRGQQLCRLDHEDPPRAYRELLEDRSRARLLEDKIAACDGVILSDYAKGVVSTAVIRTVARLARKHGRFVALDPKPSSGNEFHGLDLITPNMKEAAELAGLRGGGEPPDLAAVCRAIWRRHRPHNLVVTLGSDGMVISREGRAGSKIPTAARQVYDVSGAGDTVIAALTLALTSGADLEEAAHFANAAAGVVVGKVGTATVTPEELLSLQSDG
ncbi:MAG: bifunctional heptose 7-phosphate kinase/heptose 1-phosphate adenyltransferase [Opitutaceae bacterium]